MQSRTLFNYIIPYKIHPLNCLGNTPVGFRLTQDSMHRYIYFLFFLSVYLIYILLYLIIVYLFFLLSVVSQLLRRLLTKPLVIDRISTSLLVGTTAPSKL